MAERLCLRCAALVAAVGLYCQRCYDGALRVARAAGRAAQVIPWQERVVYGGTRQTTEEREAIAAW